MLQTGSGNWNGLGTVSVTASATIHANTNVAGEGSVSVVGRQLPSTTTNTYTLDGASKYFNTASSFSLTPQFPTVLAFIKVEAGGKQPIVSRQTDAEQSFYMELNDGVLTAGVSLDKFNYVTHTHGDITLAQNEWYQVGFKWDGRRLTTIVNSMEDSTSTFGFSTVYPVASNSAIGLTIGKTYDTGDYFQGHIAHIRIFNKPYLSGALEQLYQDGAAVCFNNLPDWAKADAIHAWEICDTSDQLVDRAGTLDLTNNGTATQISAGLPFTCDPLLNILWQGKGTVTVTPSVKADGAGTWSSSGLLIANATGDIVQASANWYSIRGYASLNATKLFDSGQILLEGEGSWTADAVLATVMKAVGTLAATVEPNVLSGLVEWSGTSSFKYLLAEVTQGVNLDINSSDKMILNIGPTTTIDLTSRVYRAFDETIVQGLTITGDDMPENLTHLVDFAHSTSEDDARKLSSIISIGHTVSANIAIIRQLTSGVGLGSDVSGTGWTDVGSFKFPEGRPITIGCPDAGVAPVLELVGPVSTINMGSPELGNSITLDLKIINESSRGGDIVIGTGESIVPDEVYLFSYRKLQNDKDAYQQFLLDNLGEKITVNWDGGSFTGVILNPETSIVENRVIILDENQNVACPYSGDPYVREWNITISILKE